MQIVTTYLDNNEVVKLQNEMKKQGLNAVQVLPNAYDHEFLKEDGSLFDGSFVGPVYTPWEASRVARDEGLPRSDQEGRRQSRRAHRGRLDPTRWSSSTG